MESAKTKSWKNNKSKDRKGFWLCFKSATLDDSFEEASRRNRAGPVLTYAAVIPTELSSASSTGDCTREARSFKGRSKKNECHCSFWQVLRTALIDKSLEKKIKKKKTEKQISCRTSKETALAAKLRSAKHDSLLQREGFLDCQKNQRTNSNASSSCHCSSAFTESSACSSKSTLSSNPRSSNYSEMSRSSSSSLLANVNTGVTKFKKESAQAQGRSDTNGGLFLLMFCLLVLILFGKLYAIVCTLIWLFAVPRLSFHSARVS